MDLYRVDTLAYGIAYSPLIATAMFHRQRLGLWLLTGVASLLIAIGAFFPLVASDLPILTSNRILSVLAVAVMAIFVRHMRTIQDRLIAETRRAEAAERIKTDVLTTLGREIPSALHALLGVVTLTMATSRPEQREALGRVRSDGRYLLAKVENLLDLTQVDEHQLSRQAIDLVSIAREAAENARDAAKDRQIQIALSQDRDGGRTAAIGDSWAMRRILDNLLDNAVRITPPGGTVSVSVARQADTVTASVSDCGSGLPPELAQELGIDGADCDGSALPAIGGTGIALSNRLARAMNGRLTAHNEATRGATFSLSLPAA